MTVCEQFTRDMEKAGYKVEQYQGPDFCLVPAVKCVKTEMQKVIRATSILLRWDQSGPYWVVYPM